MGAWGVGSFENDDALDYLAEVEDGGRGLIAGSLNFAQTEDDLELGDAVEALAAAEIVAAGVTGRLDRLPDGADSFIAGLGDLSELKAVAKSSVASVREASELRELWAGADELAAWLADVDELLARLS